MADLDSEKTKQDVVETPEVPSSSGETGNGKLFDESTGAVPRATDSGKGAGALPSLSLESSALKAPSQSSEPAASKPEPAQAKPEASKIDNFESSSSISRAVKSSGNNLGDTSKPNVYGDTNNVSSKGSVYGDSGNVSSKANVYGDTNNVSSKANVYGDINVSSKANVYGDVSRASSYKGDYNLNSEAGESISRSQKPAEVVKGFDRSPVNSESAIDYSNKIDYNGKINRVLEASDRPAKLSDLTPSGSSYEKYNGVPDIKTQNYERIASANSEKLSSYMQQERINSVGVENVKAEKLGQMVSSPNYYDSSEKTNYYDKINAATRNAGTDYRNASPDYSNYKDLKEVKADYSRDYSFLNGKTDKTDIINSINASPNVDRLARYAEQPGKDLSSSGKDLSFNPARDQQFLRQDIVNRDQVNRDGITAPGKDIIKDLTQDNRTTPVTPNRDAAPTPAHEPNQTPARELNRETTPTQVRETAPTQAREVAPTREVAPAPAATPAPVRELPAAPAPTQARDSAPVRDFAPAKELAPEASKTDKEKTEQRFFPVAAPAPTVVQEKAQEVTPAMQPVRSLARNIADAVVETAQALKFDANGAVAKAARVEPVSTNVENGVRVIRAAEDGRLVRVEGVISAGAANANAIDSVRGQRSEAEAARGLRNTDAVVSLEGNRAEAANRGVRADGSVVSNMAAADNRVVRGEIAINDNRTVRNEDVRGTAQVDPTGRRVIDTTNAANAAANAPGAKPATIAGEVAAVGNGRPLNPNGTTFGDFVEQEDGEASEDGEVLQGKRLAEDKRYLTGVELTLAALLTVAATAKTRENEQLPDLEIADGSANPNQDKQKVLHRKTHMMEPGETLQAIAERYFQDAGLAVLIAQLNVGAIKETQIEGKRVLEFKSRQLIELPEAVDIEEFRMNRSSEDLDNMITIVTESTVDHELLDSFLGTVSGQQTKPTKAPAPVAVPALSFEGARPLPSLFANAKPLPQFFARLMGRPTTQPANQAAS